MKVNVTQSSQGHIIELVGEIHGNKLYVTSVRKDVATLSLDYAHAKEYKNKSTAERIARRIEAGEISWK